MLDCYTTNFVRALYKKFNYTVRYKIMESGFTLVEIYKKDVSHKSRFDSTFLLYFIFDQS